MRAWRGLSRFEDRAGLRPWLYRIATNVCLDMLKGRGRRALPMDIGPASTARGWEPSHELALGTPRPEATWVQPIPDHLVSSPGGDPADVTVSRESIRLAFIAALQHLVPRQRAVLILRDVLSWRAHEVAELLETSEDAVNSTLRRARSALATVNRDAVPNEPTEVDRKVLYRYIEAFDRYDVDSLVALPGASRVPASRPLGGARAVRNPRARDRRRSHCCDLRLPRPGPVHGLRAPSEPRTDQPIGGPHAAAPARAPLVGCQSGAAAVRRGISGGATTLLSRRSFTRWGAAKDSPRRTDRRRQHRCLYS